MFTDTLTYFSNYLLRWPGCVDYPKNADRFGKHVNNPLKM